jgi:hypothetical protein
MQLANFLHNIRQLAGNYGLAKYIKYFNYHLAIGR